MHLPLGSTPQQQNYVETPPQQLCSLFICAHGPAYTVTITGMMLLLVVFSSLLIFCCVSQRKQKNEKYEKSRPDAVISKSYRPIGEWKNFGARRESNMAGRPGEVRPLRNLSQESDVSRSCIFGVTSQSNSISDDIFTSNHSSYA